jgi:hypothetical protein
VFILRNVIHDWPTAYVKTILKHLRASAQSHTKLIIFEFLVPYAAPSDNQFSDIPGAHMPIVPYPLLANLGTASNQSNNDDGFAGILAFSKCHTSQH